MRNRELVSLAIFFAIFVTTTASANPLGPYLDDQTVAILQIDTAAIDIEAIFAEVVRLTGLEPDASAHASKETVSGWLSDFRTAGGSKIYVVLSMVDLPRFFVVAPLADGANAVAIADLLRKAQPAGTSTGSPIYLDKFEQIGSVMIGANSIVMARIKATTPSARPEFAKALAVASDTAIRLCIVPTADSRLVIEQMLPNLPAELGGGATTDFTGGVEWLSIGVNLPPRRKILAVAQSSSPDAARNLAAAIETIYQHIGGIGDISSVFPKLDMVLTALTPTVRNDQLVIDLDSDQIETVLTEAVIPAVKIARAQARKSVCSTNLRAIGTAIALYQNDEKEDRNPPDLQTLIAAADIPRQILVCPCGGNNKGCPYIYRGSDLAAKSSSSMIVAHDAAGNHPGGRRNVLFADFHVEQMAESEFAEAIASDNELRKKADLPEKPAQ